MALSLMRRGCLLVAILCGLLVQAGLAGMSSTIAGAVPVSPADPDLVQLGPGRSFVRLASDSKKVWTYGLGRAPVEEPSLFNRGYGNDVIAVPFDRSGRVAFAPVYIYTIIPDSGVEHRFNYLVQGRTTKQDVLALFGRVRQPSTVNGYEVWYYEIKVWNPAEEFPYGGRR
jgi:hypothetical protein